MNTEVEKRVESAVVDYLVHRLERRLADRGGGRHDPGWEPRQNVVLGVLEPVIAGASEQSGEVEEETEQLLVTETEPLPSLGIDLAARPGSGQLAVSVDVEFALYVEEYPTRDEQLSYQVPEEVKSDDRSEASADPLSSRSRTTRLVSVWRRKQLTVSGVQLTIALDGTHTEVTEPLHEAIAETIDEHFRKREAARPFLTRTRTLSMGDLATDETYGRALRDVEDPEFEPEYARMILTAFAEPLSDGRFLVSVSLTNATALSEFPFQDLSAYDCRLTVRADGETTLLPQRFVLAPEDYRFADISTVYGHGRGCVAVGEIDSVRSSTLPHFNQKTIRPRRDHVPALQWRHLGNQPFPVLTQVETAMHRYLEEWDEFLGRAPEGVRAASRLERNEFEDEIRRFGIGHRAMLKDERMARAFMLANQVFDEVNASKPFDSWRLFQLVFIVSHLPALAAREWPDDVDFRTELDTADVLWFPTGGGKTEAYLGLIVVALFFDRLRGKEDGVTAWLKFPLRMLSVQQLFRVLRVLIVAESFRKRLESGNSGGPFALGYLVGGSNTPNRLVWPNGWWPGIEKASQLSEDELDRRKLISRCPLCSEKAVKLRPDLDRVRLFHTCSSCGQDLPIFVTDEEIYRYMPSVLVATVDKLTGFSFFGEFTQFNQGPRYCCPDHGWFTFFSGGKCLANRLCERSRAEYLEEDPWYDPVPALIIQDELHLLKEELGVFDAHYEGMLTELQRQGPTRMPSKLLAASATIEQYQDQLRQAYGRRPRSFPSQGFQRFRSFYTIELDDAERRYLGVLPHYRRKADVTAMVQRELISSVADLQDQPAIVAANMLGLDLSLADGLADALFNYEVSLAYVNSKAHGDQIADELGRLSVEFEGHGGDSVHYRVLTGEVHMPELADAIERVEKDSLADPRAGRLRALVGTSVVSHGVDLERLNVMVMAGLPATVADYIQATSRAGRNRIGLVVTVFDSFSRRERSTFANFISFHQFLARMVEPVPVNRFALFGADRTLPGIVMAHLWDLARCPHLDGPADGIRRTRSLAQWWRARAVDIKPLLKERIEATYRSFVPGVNEGSLEDDLVQRVMHRWEEVEMSQMVAFNTDFSRELFRSGVLTSFRDIDEPVQFGAHALSAEAFEALLGYSTDQAESGKDNKHAEEN